MVATADSEGALLIDGTITARTPGKCDKQGKEVGEREPDLFFVEWDPHVPSSTSTLEGGEGGERTASFVPTAESPYVSYVRHTQPHHTQPHHTQPGDPAASRRPLLST